MKRADSMLQIWIRCSFVLMFLGAALCTASSLTAQGDETERPEKPGKGKKEVSLKGQKKELEGDWFLTREDHPVKLSATYYYGNADKETVPVLLLHDVNGKREDFLPLIDRLVNSGYAVLAPDLRGHGKSTKRYEVTPAQFEVKRQTIPRTGGGNSGNRKPRVVQGVVPTAPPTKKLVDYEAEDFDQKDYGLMLTADLPLLRNTLEKLHAEGMVNLNRLVVVGVGRGAALASFETVRDWKDKDSGRFVRTLVLIAPADMGPNYPTSRVFTNNRLVRDNVAVLTLIPQTDVISQGVATQIRNALLDKEAEDDPGGMNSKFPVSTFPTERKSGDSLVSMSTVELFSSPDAALGKTVFEFIDARNKGFKEREARWTRLR